MIMWQTKKLGELVDEGVIQLTRGNVISKKDIAAHPGDYPIYSSAKENDGMFGRYGKYMFDEPLITWSVDGGGRLFNRPKHKFSVTNVGGILRIKKPALLDYKYLFYVLSFKHSQIKFDWVKKAHPSVIRELYTGIPLPPLPEQKRIVKKLDEVFEGVGRAKEIAEKNLKNSRELFESYLQSVFAHPEKEWEESNLNDACEVEYGYTTKAKSKGVYRLVRITDTDEYGLLTKENKMYTDSFKGTDKYILHSGDLLMARTGASAGNVLFFESDEDSVFASYLIRMKFKKDIMSKLYWYFSKSRLYWDQVKQLSAGSAQPQFNGGALKQIVFSYPKGIVD